MRDQVTCDSFLDALGDPELAFKIRERQFSDLDSALRIALQLEVWAKEMHRHREAIKPERSESRRVREINRKNDSNVEKDVENIKKFVGYGRGAPRNHNAHTLAVTDHQRRPGMSCQTLTVDQQSHLTCVDSIQHTMAGRSPPSHPTDTEIEMAISIALLTHFLDVITVETRHIELVNAQHGLTSRRHHSLNHRHNSNPMSDG